MAQFTLEALKDEIVADSLVLGYKNSAAPDDWKGDQVIADLINAINFTVSKPKISSALVRSAVFFAAYDGLSIDEQEWIRWMTGSNGFEEEYLVVTPDFRTKMVGPSDSDTIWAVSDRTAMIAAMIAVLDVPGSRAEVIFVINTSVSAGDVGRSFNLL